MILPLAETQARELNELDPKIGNARWTFTAAMVAIGFILAWATHACLVWENRHLANADHAQITLLPQTAIWWFFPGFGALSLSYEITLQIWSLFAGKEAVRKYNRWSQLTTQLQGGRYAGTNPRSALRWLALLIACPIGVLTVLALPMHVALGQTAIRDCGYAFRPCEVYPYAQAMRMTTIEGFRNRNGELTPRAGIILDFRDGRRWSSADSGDFRTSVDPVLDRFLEEKVPLPMRYAKSAEDAPSAQ
jgi:hypothetical protein